MKSLGEHDNYLFTTPKRGAKSSGNLKTIQGTSLNSQKIIKKATFYNKTFKIQPHLLSKAEKLLIDWLKQCNQEQIPIQEKIIYLLLLTINNWASYYQNNPSLALNYLTKYQDIIEHSDISKPKTLRFVSLTYYNASTLCLELKKHTQALKYAELSLIHISEPTRLLSIS